MRPFRSFGRGMGNLAEAEPWEQDLSRTDCPEKQCQLAQAGRLSTEMGSFGRTASLKRLEIERC